MTNERPCPLPPASFPPPPPIPDGLLLTSLPQDPRLREGDGSSCLLAHSHLPTLIRAIGPSLVAGLCFNIFFSAYMFTLTEPELDYRDAVCQPSGCCARCATSAGSRITPPGVGAGSGGRERDCLFLRFCCHSVECCLCVWCCRAWTAPCTAPSADQCIAAGRFGTAGSPPPPSVTATFHSPPTAACSGPHSTFLFRSPGWPLCLG